MASYPPEPWRMAGDAHLSAWRVPATEAPSLPAGLEPITVAGQLLVMTAWVEYRTPSPLTYNELLAAVAVRGERGLAGTITEIWVDDTDSLAGGRELWGIPKDMATFDTSHGRTFTASAATPATWVATAAFTSRVGAPFAPPTGCTIAQAFGDTIKSTPVRARAKPRLASASWNVNPEGPLGYLADRTPLLSAHLTDFDLLFGRRG